MCMCMYTCVCIGHEIRKETMKEEEEVKKTGETRRELQYCVGKQGDRNREGSRRQIKTKSKCVKMPQ